MSVLEATQRQTLTVTELTRRIRYTLEEEFIAVWVEGEATGVKWHTSGHLYFGLKDENAQINCVMFRRENRGVEFELSDGHAVVCFGRVSVYAPRGQYQLYVERIEPRGIGALQVRFEKLKEKLRAEGLFDDARKRALPFLPRTVGVVTSVDGAALQDILTVLARRHACARVLVRPTAVQGAEAAPMIAEAIADLNAHGEADVIVLARGGGSLEDLWAFNEEVVARAIASSDIPVVTGVGHETDFTIADFVADRRAPTPSAAAEIVLPRLEDLTGSLQEQAQRLARLARQTIDQRRERLDDALSGRGLTDPTLAFEIRRRRLDECARTLSLRAGARLALERERLGSLMGQLEALGPLAVLRRGFSVTRLKGQVVRRAAQLRPGDCVHTVLSKGTFTSVVKEIES